jgi:hypothetical protein
MSKLEAFKKKCEAKKLEKELCILCDSEFGCSVDSEPVPNPVGFAENLWMKPPVEIDEDEDASKRKK